MILNAEIAITMICARRPSNLAPPLLRLHSYQMLGESFIIS